MAGNVGFFVDDAAARALDRRLVSVGKAFDKPTVGRIIRQSLKPTLAAVKSNAPAGPTRVYQSATRVWGKNKGKTRPGYESRRGGFTRKDARIKIVSGKGNEIVAGLVGISKKGDKSGYRAHLITRANLHNKTANDFLGRSENQTKGQVFTDFGQAAEEVVTKIINKNQ